MLAAYLTARGYCSRRISLRALSGERYIVLVFPARYGPYILHHVLADKPYRYLQDLHVSGICAIVLILLRNTFRNNFDEELTVVRKTKRHKETYKFVCFLA